MTAGSFLLLVLETSPARPALMPLLTAHDSVSPAGAAVARIIQEQTKIPLQVAKWMNIVLHDSACDMTGSPAESSHFIIHGPGTAKGDGEIEATSLWREQASGDHVRVIGHDYNATSIAICLTGDNSLATASPAQLQSLHALVRSLQRRFAIGAEYVYLHADLTGGHCPGDMFNISEFPSILLSSRQ